MPTDDATTTEGMLIDAMLVERNRHTFDLHNQREGKRRWYATCKCGEKFEIGRLSLQRQWELHVEQKVLAALRDVTREVDCPTCEDHCRALYCANVAVTTFSDGFGRAVRLCEAHGDLLAVGFRTKGDCPECHHGKVTRRALDVWLAEQGDQ